MHNGKYVLAQLLDFIDKDVFLRISNKYNGNRYIKDFKWLKQHLKTKKFWGTTENAVRIQINSAITAYSMMAIVQKKMTVKRSIYEMLQTASISLTDTTTLQELFGVPNYNIVKEQKSFDELSLFKMLNHIIIVHNF